MHAKTVTFIQAPRILDLLQMQSSLTEKVEASSNISRCPQNVGCVGYLLLMAVQ